MNKILLVGCGPDPKLLPMYDALIARATGLDREVLVGIDHGRGDMTAVAIAEVIRSRMDIVDMVYLDPLRAGLATWQKVVKELLAEYRERDQVMRHGRKSQRSTLRRLRFERNKAKRLREAKVRHA